MSTVGQDTHCHHIAITLPTVCQRLCSEWQGESGPLYRCTQLIHPHWTKYYFIFASWRQYNWSQRQYSLAHCAADNQASWLSDKKIKNDKLIHITFIIFHWHLFVAANFLRSIKQLWIVIELLLKGPGTRLINTFKTFSDTKSSVVFWFLIALFSNINSTGNRKRSLHYYGIISVCFTQVSTVSHQLILSQLKYFMANYYDHITR